MENPLSDELVQAMENELVTSGAILFDTIKQEVSCVRVTFSFNEELSAALANIKLPNVIGWQVFDTAGNCLRGMRKFDNNVAVVEEQL